MSVSARNAAASDAKSVTTSGDRDRKHTEDYKTCVRRTDDAWVEVYIVYLFRKFYVSRRPTARHSPLLFTAERPVCVPYRRKGTTPDRDRKHKNGYNTSVDGRAFHGLKFTLCICSVNFMIIRRLSERHSHVFSAYIPNTVSTTLSHSGGEYLKYVMCDSRKK